MSTMALHRTFFLAITITAGLATGAVAQPTAADPHHPAATLAQAAPPSGAAGQSPGAQSGQSGMMGQGMMRQGMMGPGMMGQGRHGPMMKIMFAIADTNGDGALSFDEITAVHRRIFEAVDANNDDKVTPEELQAFMRE